MADLIGNYEFDLNRSMPTTGVDSTVKMTRAVMWTLVHQLLDQFDSSRDPASRWEHVYSSTGTVHSAVTNQWWDTGGGAGVFQPTAYTGCTNANGTAPTAKTDNGAMFALRAPSSWGTNRPTIMFVHSPPNGGNLYDWCVYVTNGIVSAPATIRHFPTTTTEWSGTWTATPNFDWCLALNNASEFVTRKCHLVIASDGAFFWGAHKTGTTRMFNGCACLPLEQPVAGDSAPWVFFRGGPTPTDGASGWPSTSYPTGLSGWAASRFVGAGTVNAGGTTPPGSGMIGINFPGTAAQTFAPAMPMVLTGDWTSQTYQRLITRSGKDPYRQTWPEFPVWLLDTSGCVRGYPRDLWLSYALAEGDVSPGGTVPVSRMIWGDFWIPAPDSVTPIVW